MLLPQCRSESRNYCTPSGKNAALFVDIDGTMLVNAPHFEDARDSFGHFMALRGFNPDEARETLDRFDRSNAEAHGFARKVFAQSVLETYRHLVREHRRRFRADQQAADEKVLGAIASLPFFREPELFAHAAAVLNRAHHSFLIFAVSIGDREAQKYKVAQSGLRSVFEDLIITERDNKQQHVARAIRDCNIDPRLSGFIGNSIRSDGVCLTVTNFIYLPMEGGWAFDSTHSLPQDTGFEVIEAKDWRDAEEQGINSLVRRRKFGVHSPAEERPCAHKR